MPPTNASPTGADRNSARLSSLKDFGNVTLATEAARSVWTPWWVDTLRDLAGDVRHAIRVLAKNPGFSLTVVAVLTLGIGLNAAVFTLLKSLALTPIAGVAGSARLLVVLNETSGGRQDALSYPHYQFVRDHDRAFVGLIGTRNINVNLGSGNRAEPIRGEMVTGNYFQQLGVRAQLGRTLLPSDEVAPGQHPVVVLSDTLWRRHFGSDPDIVGKTVRLNAYPMTVVGVAAPSFHGTIVSFDVEVFVPIMMTPQLLRPASVDPQTVLSDSQASSCRSWVAPVRGRRLHRRHRRWLRCLPNCGATRPSMTSLRTSRSCRSGGRRSGRRPNAAGSDGVDRDGRAAAADRLREYHRPRARARRLATRRNRAPSGSRRQPCRIVRFCWSKISCWPYLARWWPLRSCAGLPAVFSSMTNVAPIRLFFNLSVDRLVIAFSVLAACASALVFGLFPALRSSGVELCRS